MKNSLLLLVLICSLGLLISCGGGAGGGQVGGGGNQIVVGLSPSSPQSIDMNQADPISASVTGDRGRGVKWTVSCPVGVNSCGGMAQSSTKSGVQNMFNAPINVASAETVTVTATSFADSSKFATVPVTVTPTPTFANPPPAQPQLGTVGQPFSFSLAPFVQGGSTPFDWTVKSGTLPAGLSLAAASGMISGTPTAPTASTAQSQAPLRASATSGTATNLVFTGTDSGKPNLSVDVPISIIINSQSGGALAITSSQPPNGMVGQPYDGTQTVAGRQFSGFQLTATGGTPSYSWGWAAAQGSSLPPGLTISSLTIGSGDRCCITVVIITGTPTVAGTFHVVVTVADLASPPARVSASYTIKVTGTTVAANPVPLLNLPLMPAVAVPGGAAFKLTLSGTGFVVGSVVRWNGSPRVTTFVSKSKLTADILASDISAPNTATVIVINPAPGGGTSNVAFFEINMPTSWAALGPPANFAVGSGPGQVAIGRFNADGKIDLAVVNGFGNNLSILVGNGDGTFLPAVNYSVGQTPTSVAVGDFNDDGKLDLTITNSGTNDVSILLGNGDGTFQPAVNYSVGQSPFSVAVGDFNSDGKLDLALTNIAGSNVSILLGNGDGSFQSAVNYSVGQSPDSVVVGDFNYDGKLDLAVANHDSNTVSILLGNGDGSFQPAADYNAAQSPGSMVVADFNADGKLDLAQANTLGNYVSILLGNGDGTFQPPVNYVVSGSEPSLAVGDLNGDGKLDLAIANSGTGDVTILFGNGDGTFHPTVTYTTGEGASAVAVADFNGDGSLDLAVPGTAGPVISILSQSQPTSGPTVTLSATRLIFQCRPAINAGCQCGTARIVTLSNLGSETLNITGITITGPFTQGNNCGAALQPGQSCAIDLKWSENNGVGVLSVFDDGPGSPQTVNLLGQKLCTPAGTISANLAASSAGCVRK